VPLIYEANEEHRRISSSTYYFSTGVLYNTLYYVYLFALYYTQSGVNLLSNYLCRSMEDDS